MAQKIITQLVDDTNGEEIPDGKGETLTFAIDHQSYTIDLTDKNAAAFRGLFQDYIAVAAKVGRKRARTTKRSASPRTSEVRAWARENGWPKLGDRGRIPADAQAAFDAR